jgi:hydrogenase expression/formation protein HypC
MCLGIPGEVLEIREAGSVRMGLVRFGGVTREVCLEAQPDAGPGDFVLVHVGMAIAKIDRAQAEKAWQVLEDLGETGETRETGEAGEASQPSEERR